jgi:hypothetical protein
MPSVKQHPGLVGLLVRYEENEVLCDIHSKFETMVVVFNFYIY